jgi:hypothetical protein
LFLAPLFLTGLGHEFLLDLIAHLIAHHIGDVGNAHLVLRRGLGWQGGDVLLRGGSGGVRFGLLDHFLGFFLREDAFGDEAVDQIDGDVFSGCCCCRFRLGRKIRRKRWPDGGIEGFGERRSRRAGLSSGVFRA